jgi:hypothetical protein
MEGMEVFPSVYYRPKRWPVLTNTKTSAESQAFSVFSETITWNSELIKEREFL